MAPAENKALQYLPGPINTGDQVEIIPYGRTAEVISLKAKYANVLTGSVTIKIPLKDLRKIKDSGITAHKKSYKASRSVMSNIHERAAQFKPSIDLRGKRAWEALEEIQRYIDDAILLSVKEVSILHGKGDGILRQIIREYLQGIDEIEQFRDAHVERGGQGITIVRLR